MVISLICNCPPQYMFTYKCLFFKLIMLSSQFFLTGPYANVKPRGKDAIQLQAGKHISTQGKINCYTIKYRTKHNMNLFIR